MKYLLSLLVVLSTILPAQAVLKWDYQSTSLTQSTYAAGLRDMAVVGSSTASLSAAPASSIGSTVLHMVNQPFIVFPASDNGPVGSTSVCFMWSVLPTFTGNPAGTIGLMTLANSHAASEAYGGFDFEITTASKLQVSAYTPGGTAYFNSVVASTGFTFVSGTRADLYWCWDGSTTSGHATLWQGSNTGAPTSVATMTAGNAMTAAARSAMTEIFLYNLDHATFNSVLDINELAIWDDSTCGTGVACSSLGTRTTFLTSTAYEGYTSTALGAGSVLNGTAYGPGPGSLTGTYVTVSTANVASGVTFGAGSASTGSNVGAGFNTDPGIANVANGTTYKILNVSLTGTQGATTDPGIANVRLGTSYSISGSSLTGTLAVPTRAQVLLGIATDNTTGLRDDAIPANVLTGIVYGDGTKTGTLQFNINFPKVILGL